MEVACGSQVPPGEAWAVEEKGGSRTHINLIMEITHMAYIPDLEVLVLQVGHSQLQAMLQQWTCFQHVGNQHILLSVKRHRIHTSTEHGLHLRDLSRSHHLPVALLQLRMCRNNSIH